MLGRNAKAPERPNFVVIQWYPARLLRRHELILRGQKPGIPWPDSKLSCRRNNRKIIYDFHY
jgi:hypothetical protein